MQLRPLGYVKGFNQPVLPFISVAHPALRCSGRYEVGALQSGVCSFVYLLEGYVPAAKHAKAKSKLPLPDLWSRSLQATVGCLSMASGCFASLQLTAVLSEAGVVFWAKQVVSWSVAIQSKGAAF